MRVLCKRIPRTQGYLARIVRFQGADGIEIRDMVDGTSNIIMVVEANEAAIPWTSPRDIDASKNPGFSPNGLSSHHVGGSHVLTGDGAVKFMSENVSPQLLKSMFTIDGGESAF